MSMMQDPAARVAAVTKSDSTRLAGVRGLYVGGAGNISLKTKGMTDAVTLVGVLAGSIIPVRAEYVMDATTATSIVALY